MRGQPPPETGILDQIQAAKILTTLHGVAEDLRTPLEMWPDQLQRDKQLERPCLVQAAQAQTTTPGAKAAASGMGLVAVEGRSQAMGGEGFGSGNCDATASLFNLVPSGMPARWLQNLLGAGA